MPYRSVFVAASLFLLAAFAAAWHVLRGRSIDIWLGSYLVQSPRRRNRKLDSSIHVLLCIADHFEPLHGKVTHDQAQSRVDTWCSLYPANLGSFRDSDGRPPRHTFFYPLDEYDAGHIDAVAGLCRAGFGEIEMHLHHDNDTAESLRKTLIDGCRTFRDRHGLLPNNKLTGQLQYGFVHGNWALDNSHPAGRHCGVNNELDVLLETGCYADFTMPSAPDRTQTSKINSIYYAVDDPVRPKSHDRGVDVGTAPRPPRSLLLVQGPLVLDWGRRRGGIIPSVENGCLQGSQLPTMRRLDLWCRASVRVATRPDWYFVKLHTHGAPEKNQAVLLGKPMIDFHTALAARAAADPRFHFHYVTAREMYNLVRAAESNWTGTVADARDFEITWELTR
jgi:hypothetical protein